MDSQQKPLSQIACEAYQGRETNAPWKDSDLPDRSKWQRCVNMLLAHRDARRLCTICNCTVAHYYLCLPCREAKLTPASERLNTAIDMIDEYLISCGQIPIESLEGHSMAEIDALIDESIAGSGETPAEELTGEPADMLRQLQRVLQGAKIDER